MGDPRHFKNKYERPKKLWEKSRIEEESALKREYGLKNTREVWIAAAELKKYRREARRLLSVLEEERAGDVEKIMARLSKYGILEKGASLDDILSLEVRAVLERRFQTRVLKKGLAKTMSQSRQLITHGYISINGRKVTSPGHMVTKEEDVKIGYYKPINLQDRTKTEEASAEKTEEPVKVAEPAGE
ncbi:30S ribosomal protein S4 [Candidatus Micrarchaeota archaeon]|nr:30S ribosomal protein S4 [Candidatus Micrarchaeota archaeon]